MSELHSTAAPGAIPASDIPAPTLEKSLDLSSEKPASSSASTSEPPPPPEQSPRTLSGLKWIICVLSIYSAVFLYALDNTIVATIQPNIIKDLHHLDKLPWVSVAYNVASVALDLTWGKLYGKFNAKTLFLASILIFEVGSAVCGAAPSIDAEIVGRAICGIGGIGIYMGALNLLAVTTTNKERPLYISMMGICWGSGTVLGPVIGGAFADSKGTWRWSFYINLVIGGVASPAYFLLLPNTNQHLKGTKLMERIRSIDWVGTLLITGAVVSGIMGVSFGGVLYAWGSGKIIACFVVSGVLWIVFGLQQAFAVFTTKTDRIFPCDIVLNWEADVLFAQTATGLGASLVAIYFIPLYFQFVRGESALTAGVKLLPMMFLMILASNLTGYLLGRGFWFMPLVLVGGVLVVIGGALMYALVDPNTGVGPIYGYSILIGFGAGLFTQGPISAVQSLFSLERVAEATAFVAFGQVVGITIMLAVANAVFLNRATYGLEHLLPNATLSEVQGAIQGVSSDLLTNLPPATQEAVKGTVVHSLNKVYILVFVAGAVAAILAPFIKRRKP